MQYTNCELDSDSQLIRFTYVSITSNKLPVLKVILLTISTSPVSLVANDNKLLFLLCYDSTKKNQLIGSVGKLFFDQLTLRYFRITNFKEVDSTI